MSPGRTQVIAIVALVLLLPLLMWPGLTDYNYAKTIVGLIAISVLLVMWGARVWREPCWTIHTPRVLIALMGFIVAGALSAISASSGRVVAQSLVLVIYFVLLFWMIADVVRDRRDVMWILMALLVSGVLASCYGMLQYAGVVGGSPGQIGVNAIISTMGNRNHLGGFLLYLFYPGVIVLLAARSRWAKTFALLALALSFFMMLVVRQASTRVTFPFVTLCLVAIWLIFRPAKPIRANRVWLCALAGIVCAITLLWITSPLSTHQDTSESTSEISTQSDEDSPIGTIQSWFSTRWKDNSGQERMWFWQIGKRMLTDHPITGVGLGNYKLDFFRYQSAAASADDVDDDMSDVARAAQAHSEPVQIGAELGSVGLFTMLCALGTLAVSLWIRLKHNNEPEQLELMLLSCGILAFLVHSLVSFPAHVVGSSLELVVFCGVACSARYGQSMSTALKLCHWKGKLVHAVLVVIAVAVSAIAVADLCANWLMERGFSQVASGNHAVGEPILQRSLDLDFAPRQTYYYLAAAQIQLGNLKEAQENLERCMTLFPDTEVVLTYSELLVDMQEPAMAQSVLDTVLHVSLQETDEQRARFLEGRIAVQEKEYDRAIRLFESLAVDHPSYEMSYVALGQIYAGLGASALARTSFLRALDLITQKLASVASDSSLPSLLSETQQDRQEIELMTRQIEYLREQLAALP